MLALEWVSRVEDDDPRIAELKEGCAVTERREYERLSLPGSIFFHKLTRLSFTFPGDVEVQVVVDDYSSGETTSNLSVLSYQGHEMVSYESSSEYSSTEGLWFNGVRLSGSSTTTDLENRGSLVDLPAPDEPRAPAVLSANPSAWAAGLLRDVGLPVREKSFTRLLHVLGLMAGKLAPYAAGGDGLDAPEPVVPAPVWPRYPFEPIPEKPPAPPKESVIDVDAGLAEIARLREEIASLEAEASALETAEPAVEEPVAEPEPAAPADPPVPLVESEASPVSEEKAAGPLKEEPPQSRTLSSGEVVNWRCEEWDQWIAFRGSTLITSTVGLVRFHSDHPDWKNLNTVDMGITKNEWIRAKAKAWVGELQSAAGVWFPRRGAFEKFCLGLGFTETRARELATVYD